MNYNAIEDSELITLFTKGDQQALKKLVYRYERQLFAFVLSRVKCDDEASDVFQDVVLKVVEKLLDGAYNEQGIFSHWLILVARNHITDVQRKSSRDKDAKDRMTSELLSEVDLISESCIIKEFEDFERTNTQGFVQNLIQRLPPEQREVIRLRYFKGLTFREIAKITGSNINTVASRLNYAIANLRRFYRENQLKESEN